MVSFIRMNNFEYRFMKFTSRDIKVFLLGMLAMLLIDLALGWKDFVKGFEEGFHSVSK